MSLLFETLYDAKSIAIVGASLDRQKIGNAVMENLVKEGYGGRILPVNPSHDEIMGFKCFKSVEELPQEVDLAIIALPARAAMNALDQCVRKSVRFVVLIAGGFSETGDEGRELELQIRNRIAGTDTRVIGPNTVGVLFPPSRINTALTPWERIFYPGKGEVAFISQSGALGLLVMDSITEFGMGISGFVNIGNRVDISEIDMLELFYSDSSTRSIVLYLESISDGQKFFDTLKKVNPVKPVVVLKTGRSDESSRAASFHTGAMASDDRVFDGVLRQVGVIRAYDETELLDYGKVLAYQKPPAGNRIAVVTTAGGVGVVTTDALTFSANGDGMRMATLSEEEKNELRKYVLPFASVNNPVDLTADGSGEAYESILNILARSENVDGIIAYALPQTPKIDMGIVPSLANTSKLKPLVVGSIGNKLAKPILSKLEEYRVPAYPSIERAVKAMRALYRYGEYLRREQVAN